MFKYDYMGRRVEKRVIPWNPNLGTEGDWDVDNPDSVRRFVYHNWLPLLELKVENIGTPSETMTILRKYTWGIDLSQTLDGAGGIGGLLATYDTQGTPETTDDRSYFYLYDANGNVGQVLDASDGSIEVKYEYDVYGNRINLPDPSEYDNPFRFSTKYWDDETGLGYWGYRYYSPRLGRWITRDPAEEDGGDNVYGFTRNDTANEVDFLGLWKIDRQGRPRALAVSEVGDTVRELAETIRLEPDEYDLWLKPAPDALPQSPDQPLGCNCRYTVPNFTAYVWGKLKRGRLENWQFACIFADFRSKMRAVIDGDKSRGYMVLEYKQPPASVIKLLLRANRNLAKFAYAGHTDVSGALTPIIPIEGRAGRVLAATVPEMVYRTRSNGTHKLEAMMLLGCGTARTHVTNLERGTRFASWGMNVSSLGWFIGYTGEPNALNWWWNGGGLGSWPGMGNGG